MKRLDHEVGIWDSVLLEPLTEEVFLNNLRERYKWDQIYTYIGNMLISINPNRVLPLYSSVLAEIYARREPFQLPPHIYAIASTAYRWLIDRNQDQSIILTGESGSGKTEAARIVLQFLVLTTPCNSESQFFKESLIQANTVLEAFGNARTSRNNNASRFGKLLDVQMDCLGNLIGANLTFYCLDKTRITKLGNGDRNYHIFYQLISGADPQLLKCLRLQRNIEQYYILYNENDSTSLPIVDDDDPNLFKCTHNALQKLLFSDDDILAIFQIMAVVLKLGNLKFVPSKNIDGTSGSSVSNEYELLDICELLGVEYHIFLKALTIHYVEGDINYDLNFNDASRLRYSLCSTIYSRLFSWIIARTNSVLKGHKVVKQSFLSLLDLYGFEVLEHNGFEQLIINYCNEKLQQFIIGTVLRADQEGLIQEGITWTTIEYFDNILEKTVRCNFNYSHLKFIESLVKQMVVNGQKGALCQFCIKKLYELNCICELMDAKHGILSLLNNVQSSNGSAFLIRLEQCCSGHSHCSINRKEILHSKSFLIHHYAKSVRYDVYDFIYNNHNSLLRQLSCILYNCDHHIMKQLFPEGNLQKHYPHSNLESDSEQIQTELHFLLEKLHCRQCHYVRCIKPNEMNQSYVFDLPLVRHQVRYLNLVPVVKLYRYGYCYRISFSQFFSRYRIVCKRTWPKWFDTDINGVVEILSAIPLPGAEFTFGRSSVLIRSPRTLFELESLRRFGLNQLATVIQKYWKGYRHRKQYRLMRISQIIIASVWKQWKMKQQIINKKYQEYAQWAAFIIQRHYIQWKRRQYLLKLPWLMAPNSDSPICRIWPIVYHPKLTTCNILLRKIHHKWRCYRYRLKFDQVSRNRMREKVTASLIFKDRKSSYSTSVSDPFNGDYIHLRHNVQWRKVAQENNDQYVVFADVVNKITRSNGKCVSILLVISTQSMLLLDHRSLQIKYRIPAAEIYRISLSPYIDNVAVIHVKSWAMDHPISNSNCTSSEVSGCLFQSSTNRAKGDFIFQTDHVIEVVTKLFLVVQNVNRKPPEINISTEFDASFDSQTVTVTFKCSDLKKLQDNQVRIHRRNDKMEIVIG